MGIPSNKIGIIDARTAGVSGDKYLGALIDLGASESRLKRVGKVIEESLPGTHSVEISVKNVERGDIRARLVDVSSKEQLTGRKAEALLKYADACSEKLGLSNWGRKFTSSTIKTLAMAESKVHGHPLDTVEFHELGSADTLVDVLGVAYLIEELGLSSIEWISSSIAVGTGLSHFSGRYYPNPPPAVAEILRTHSFPVRSGPAELELSTPTGVGITVNLAKTATDLPPVFEPKQIGYGAGTAELSEVPNILRLIIGRNVGHSHSHDEVVVLETNLDDVTGEVIGHAVERIMAAGAKDVTVTPVLMKKSRPGYVVSVITDSSKAEALAQVIIEETGTLGVREIPVRRHIMSRTHQRRIVEIRGKRYPVRVKAALDKRGNIVREKVEYDDKRRLSEKTGLSLRSVENLLKRNASERHS